MAVLKRLLRRIQSLLHPDRVHNEIADEISFHIEQRTEENMRKGMNPEDARREAQQRFGLSHADQGTRIRSSRRRMDGDVSAGHFLWCARSEAQSRICFDCHSDSCPGNWSQHGVVCGSGKRADPTFALSRSGKTVYGAGKSRPRCRRQQAVGPGF